ncbi:hypothetical protein A3A66_02745 [Microgenomates group bacterium RIFCSPLOWO2_01_FULL_46_13]|nr:MAG: hypothetical protein A2783_02995 [Microgenomates group bacterium RIFCSPHIGHO2_01_FULL_45_11]OGV94887.1 MAG: hypothetical protein A3A66_02745 [Microgenomates group bacterium RIFCSPLOWO2_01_FULL_46_13]
MPQLVESSHRPHDDIELRFRSLLLPLVTGSREGDWFLQGEKVAEFRQEALVTVPQVPLAVAPVLVLRPVNLVNDTVASLFPDRCGLTCWEGVVYPVIAVNPANQWYARQPIDARLVTPELRDFLLQNLNWTV